MVVEGIGLQQRVARIQPFVRKHPSVDRHFGFVESSRAVQFGELMRIETDRSLATVHHHHFDQV